MEGPLYDLLYVTGTIVFFALMIAYVAGCQSLGRSEDASAQDIP